MRQFLSLLAALFVTATVYAQKTRSLELELRARYDKHAAYTSRFFNRSYTNDTRLWGTSFGINLNYIHPLSKSFAVKAGMGYYRLGVDKVRQTTPFNIIATARNIDYQHPSGIQPLFSTKTYHYDNLCLTIGVDHTKPLGKKTGLVIGSDLNYLYTFSQLYRIPYEDIRYRTHDGRTLGIAVNAHVGINRSFNRGRNYLGAKCIVPVYQQLHGDNVFGEDHELTMIKWLDGIGLSFAIGKYF